MSIHYQDATVTIHAGDCLDVLRGLPDASVDAVVTDPPYGLEFMGKGWDAPWEDRDVNADAGFNGGGIDATKSLPSFTGSTNPKCLDCKGTRRGRRDGTAKVAVCLCPDGGRFPNVRAVEMRAFGDWCELWAAECLRVLKPGGHLLAFGGTRTWHRLACAIEDAGFEVRDSIAWLYGSGFPKSLDVSKAIDKAARGVPQGGADPTSPNHGRFRTTTTEGKRWDGDSGQGYGAGGSRFLADGMASGSATAPVESGDVDAVSDAARTWQGWGTALKPAHEPIVVARKPLAGTVAGNVLAHGTGALNIDATRIDSTDKAKFPTGIVSETERVFGAGSGMYADRARPADTNPAGRWPANVVLDESQAVALDQQSGEQRDGVAVNRNRPAGGKGYDASAYEIRLGPGDDAGYGGQGGASRFFYVAKADASERIRLDGTAHPTVKPLALMRWLVRLVTPPGGTVLEPFAGSGTTVEACILEGFHCIGIEREPDYLPLIVQRIHRRRDPVAAVRAQGDDAGLFDLLDTEEPA